MVDNSAIHEVNTDADILQLLRDALAYADPKVAAASSDAMTMTSTLADLGIESVCALEMVGYVEDKLNILFSDDEMSKINDIPGFVALIRKHHQPLQEKKHSHGS
ncbi:MAG: acyl carrier protein [Proteobacteria bacterium]|nr:acyl carrier protein [Pseudomonadota bacterium]